MPLSPVVAISKRDDKYKLGGQIELDNVFITTLIPEADDSTSYKKLKHIVKSHQAQVVKPEDLPKVLPWVHIAIGNVKRLLLDMHHQLAKEYLQYYLNEFCYKFYRRYFGKHRFDRLVMVAVSYQTNFRSRIYNRSICG